MTAAQPITHSVRYKDIPGYPGYMAGDDGSIWSSLVGGEWRRLKGAPNENGYIVVSLKGPDGKSHYCAAHRLILEAFVGPCPPGKECCHFPDPRPSNNRLSNLRWATPEQNRDDYAIHCEIASESGYDHRAQRRCEIIRLHAQGYAIGVISQRVGISLRGVRKALGIR